MKRFCCFVAIAVCLGITSVAHAASSGFAMNILDPLTGGTPEFSNSFPIGFTQCSGFSNESEFPSIITTGASAADYGCFEGMNAAGIDRDDCEDGVCTPDSDDTGGTTWTSLDMTFGNNSFLNGQTPSCSSIDPSLVSLFSSNSCSYNGSTQTYSLDFSGTPGIAPGESFLIVEYSTTVSPGQFPTVAGVAGVVPEPNGALLMATGGTMFGLLLYTERRRLLRQPVRS